MALPVDFDAAVAQSKELPSRPSNEDLLQLYALFKQATDGDASGDRPGGFDFKAIAKFDAWSEKKGTSKEAAMQQYVSLVERLKKELAWLNLFYQPGIPQGITYLDAEESRHAIRVLRMSEGDPLTLTDGSGFFYTAQIAIADSKKCEFNILEKREVKKRDFSIHIAIAPTKNADRMEWFVEKAVEIGVEEISFILCKNSERKTVNMDRIWKIAVSALKQSQQAWLPKINEIVPLNRIFNSPADQKFIAHVDSTNPKQLQSEALALKKYLILIGPEGDFSPEELATAIQHGFVKVSLGTHRLRTETAGLVAVQVLGLTNTWVEIDL